MAFTANEIKNLALQEINHETISDWTDSSNTDIPIINSQYALAKSVALTMYQWSWAFKYVKIPVYKYRYELPADWESGSTFWLYYPGTVTQITDFSYQSGGTVFYTNEPSVVMNYYKTGHVWDQANLDGVLVSETMGKYKYATFLPTDFLGYLACYANEQMTILADYMTVGTLLYSNTDTLYIKYIGAVDEGVFPPEFVDWFKIFLAQRINGYLNGDMQRQQLLNGEEPFYFRKAKNIDSKRNKHESLSGNPMLWIRGKIGGGI